VEPLFLPAELKLPDEFRQRLNGHYESGTLKDLTVSIPDVLANDFAIDIRAKYGPLDIAHPIGKASGQLSLQTKQVKADAEAGLGFVVLKTVIAEDERGGASMEAWKIKEPRMEVERIRGRRVDREGWTVSWAGRGWEGSLASYLTFTGEALRIGAEASMPVVPSVKYHLPARPEEPFLTKEYDVTTRALEETWRGAMGEAPLVLEQDFSPTLAGTDMAGSKRLILKWLGESPALIKAASPRCTLGVKLMNALFEDEFQLEMMEVVCAAGHAADLLICFNRLFDPERMFGTKKGIAVGGPDLSDRNLTILRRAIAERRGERHLPISATGDIVTGRMMIEYALRGATSGQIHTYFQLPMNEYSLKGVSRTRAALHELYFHPGDGLVAAMCHLRETAGGGGRYLMRFLDLPRLGCEWMIAPEATKASGP
jgi:hypothetical protein